MVLHQHVIEIQGSSRLYTSVCAALLFLSISHEVEPCHGAMLPCTASVTPLLRSLHSILIRLTNISRQPIVMFTALCLFPSFDLVIERFVWSSATGIWIQHVSNRHNLFFLSIWNAHMIMSLRWLLVLVRIARWKKKTLTPLPVYNTVINTIHFSNTQHTQHKKNTAASAWDSRLLWIGFGFSLALFGRQSTADLNLRRQQEACFVFFTSQERAC